MSLKKDHTKQKLGFRWERLAIYTTGVALVVLVFTPTVRRPLLTSVEGVSIVKGFFSQATVQLPHVAGVRSFNIYYGSSADAGFPNAVRNIDPNVVDYTISYLRNGLQYHYKISAVNAEGAEFYWTPTIQLMNLQPM